MNFSEWPVVFDCEGQSLVGIVAEPNDPKSLGVVIAVGGPQYRVGSHRQFALLSRALAEAGYPVLRFDYRGMGDSSGERRGFECVSEDIGSAIDALTEVCPWVRRVVLWGLCDGASAALLYWGERKDARVAGLCLLNPYVESETSAARAQVRHYYVERLFDRGFWWKVMTGRVDIGASLTELAGKLSTTLRRRSVSGPAFSDDMAKAWRAYPGRMLVILSDKDPVAHEFVDLVGTDPAWAGMMDRENVSRCDVKGANHTFSTAAWRSEVERTVLEWLSGVAG